MEMSHEQPSDMPAQDVGPIHAGHAPDVRSGGHAMAMRELPYGRALLWIVGTFLALLLALVLTAHWVPIEFATR